MNPTTENKIRRIERMSVVLRGLCSALLGIVGIATLVAIVAALAGRLNSLKSFGISVDLGELAPESRVAAAFVVFITGAIALKALFHLRRLMDNYARQEIFTVDSARQLRRFGSCCVLWFGIELLWLCLPAVQRAPAAAPAPLNLDALILGAVIIGVSWFTEMAAELRAENDLTI
jgi:hypothetical protein